MKAIILAAGRSSRLYPLTLDKPKCLLDLGGKSVIEHQIDLLHNCGIKDVVIVVGYLSERIKHVVGHKARFIEYKNFAKTNNLHTLWTAKEELNDDVVCLFADVVFSEKTLRRCAEDQNDFSLLVHTSPILANTMRVKIKDNSIIDIGSHIPVEEGSGNFIGVAKFSKNGAKLVQQQLEKMVADESYTNSYYTMTLPFLAQAGHSIGFQSVQTDPWIEIDFQEDYEKAKHEIYPLVKTKANSTATTTENIDMRKARREGREYTTHALRYISRPISKILIKHTNITPNQITLFSFLLGITSGIFLLQGGFQSQFLGGVFAMLYILFDLMDGEIARVKNLSSSLGKWFDAVVGLILTPYLLFCLAFGLHNYAAMIAGAIAMVCFPLQYAIMYYYKFDIAQSSDKIPLPGRFDFLRRLYGSVTFYPLLFLFLLLDKGFYFLLFYATLGNLFWMLVLMMQYRQLRAKS